MGVSVIVGVTVGMDVSVGAGCVLVGVAVGVIVAFGAEVVGGAVYAEVFGGGVDVKAEVAAGVRVVVLVAPTETLMMT